MTFLNDSTRVLNERGYHEEEKWDPRDTRWPVSCEKCQFTFRESDPKQLFARALYSRDTGEVYTLEDAPSGAMWYADWYTDETTRNKGPDGRCLCVKLPNGNTWIIDSRASNCDMPNDDVHRCWVRHGEPPMITVDKNGLTCRAGAGSILSRSYHGHLINGELNPC